MSIDPSAIIVAPATALGGAIHGSEAPPALKDYGTQQVQQITDAAPAIGQQVNEAIEHLPPEAQGAAQQAITDTADAVQEAIEASALPPESALPHPTRPVIPRAIVLPSSTNPKPSPTWKSPNTVTLLNNSTQCRLPSPKSPTSPPCPTPPLGPPHSWGRSQYSSLVSEGRKHLRRHQGPCPGSFVLGGEQLPIRRLGAGVAGWRPRPRPVHARHLGEIRARRRRRRKG